MPGMLHGRPVVAALAGALAIAFSAILFRLAEVSPATGAFFRCTYALPVLWLLAFRENRRFGRRPWPARRLALLAGVLFAFDLVFWHYAIEAVGAGLATVLGNTQVVLVGLLAWALLGERPHTRALAAIPVVLIGVVLFSGALEEGAYGENPALGVLLGVLTGIAYSGFLLLLRQGSGDLRRQAGPLFDATLVSAAVIVPVGLALGDIDFLPRPEAQAWLGLLALSSQVLGWLLIGVSLPRLPAALTSVLLTFQPACAVVFSAIILGEDPSPLQLAGAAAILAGLLVASGRRGRAKLREAGAVAVPAGAAERR
jgi:drug/metabolite transporter (DMT)-like permease